MSSLLPPISEHAVFAPVQADVDDLITMVKDAVGAGTAAHTLELGLWRSLLELGHQLFQGFLTLSGQGDVGARLTLEDGREIKRLAARTRPYRNLFGEYEIERFVYAQREGQTLEAIPLDQRLQLPQGCTSYLLSDWNTQLMQETPYAHAAGWLERVLGLRQSVQTLERDQGRLSAQAERFWEQVPVATPLAAGMILVDTLDGKGVCMRPSETQGERGKKKMALLGSVYGIAPYVRTPEQVLAALFADTCPAPPSGARPKPLTKHVRACLKRDDADTTAPQTAEICAWIAQQNALRDPEQSHPSVLLIDGQTNLWQAMREAVPGEQVTEILDLLHASGYVWEAAKLLHPNDSPAAEAAAKRDLRLILHGQVGEVIAMLQRDAESSTGTRRKTLEGIAGYFDKHRDRIAYDLYLAEGFPIATGVIEGACRCLVKDRMERAGMRWVMAGAQSMLALRSITLSGLWEEFMAFYVRDDLRRRYGTAVANDDTYHWLAA